MKDPVDHIIRPRLPWRAPNAPAVTECGYDASKVQAITREQFFRREKDMGRQRCAMLTCMTCSDTARRWASWEDDPRQALSREIEWERGAYYQPRENRGRLLLDELLVIASLIEAHRDEFETSLKNMIERREWNEKKATLHKRPKQREPGGLW